MFKQFIAERGARDSDYLQTSVFSKRKSSGFQNLKMRISVDQTHRFRVPSVVKNVRENVTTEVHLERQR
jgi:hypothetical protein